MTTHQQTVVSNVLAAVSRAQAIRSEPLSFDQQHRLTFADRRVIEAFIDTALAGREIHDGMTVDIVMGDYPAVLATSNGTRWQRAWVVRVWRDTTWGRMATYRIE